MRPALALLLLAVPAIGAPRLKDRPYVPADWIDRLANEPADRRPWDELERRIRGLSDEEWYDVGVRLAAHLHRRAARLGTPDGATVFDDAAEPWKYPPIRGHVSSVLLHWKWVEWSGQSDAPVPPWFWEQGPDENRRDR